LLRGDMDEVDRLQPIDLARVQHDYALAAAAARLDALDGASHRHRRHMRSGSPAAA